jgi:hypothetical protein
VTQAHNLPPNAVIEGYCIDPADGLRYPYGKASDGTYWVADQFAWAGWRTREARDKVLSTHRRPDGVNSSPDPETVSMLRGMGDEFTKRKGKAGVRTCGDLSKHRGEAPSVDGMFPGESVAEAARNWQGWCDYRSMTGLAAFLGKVAALADGVPGGEVKGG